MMETVLLTVTDELRRQELEPEQTLEQQQAEQEHKKSGIIPCQYSMMIAVLLKLMMI